MGVRIVSKKNLTADDEKNIRIIKDKRTNYCMGYVSDEYVKYSIDNAHYVVFSEDANRGLKGFATLYHDHKLSKLLIDVICNLGETKYELRTPQVAEPGKEILDKIVEFGRDTLNVSYLELHSLEHVITYYSKFGWKFLDVNKNNQCVQNKDYSQEIENLKNALKENNPWKITYRLNKFKDFEEGKRSDGYTMRFCLSPPIVSLPKTISSLAKRLPPTLPRTRRTPTLTRTRTRRTPTITRRRTRKISRRPHTASRQRTTRRSRAGKTIR